MDRIGMLEGHLKLRWFEQDGQNMLNLKYGCRKMQSEHLL